MKNIDVSFVMTVYNKEYYLPSVLMALLGQTGLSNPEFIFIDDVSVDKSVEIIKEMTEGLPNITIITNKENKGISVRTNQGIALAKGKWIRMLDSDDILPLNSTESMIAIAEKLNVDMVYGQFVKTGKEPIELESETINDFEYEYHENALEAVLNGRYTRMGQLIKTQVLKDADGADERVFIQDESVPVRAAIKANGIVKILTDVVLVPKEIGNFSSSKIQLDHDRFLAYYWALKDNTELDEKYLAIMYQRAVSAFWKYVRKTSKIPYLHPIFAIYLFAKVRSPKPNMEYLDKIYAKLADIPNVRRIEKSVIDL